MTESDRVRAFEDRRWSEKDQTPVWRHRAALELVRQEPVLDVGGGDGLLLRMLRDRGITDVRLTDLSPVGVEKARIAGFPADVVDVTVEPLPFGDDAFGTVCALDVLEHLREPLRALREMARVGREVVVAVPNFAALHERLTMLKGGVPFQSRPQRGHVHWFDEPTLRRLFEDAGVRVDAWRVEPSRRLGRAGVWLADRRPNLFGVAFAARLVKG
jgi:methionine biosynthesis protein MetW